MIDYGTPYGMGLVNDSFAYIIGVRNLLEGNGYSRTAGSGEAVPLTHFPPFLSMVLTVFGAFGIDALQAIRILNICLFAVNGLLIGLVIHRITASSPFSVLGAALFLSSESFISIHTFALSEPLFIFQILIIILMLNSYLNEPRLYQVPILGIMIGVAYLTRYIGVSVFGMVLLALLVIKNETRSKTQQILLYAISSAILPLAWSIRNARLTGNFANRAIFYHPISRHKWYEGIANFWDWLFPGNFNLYGRNPTFFMILLCGIIFAVFFIIVYGLTKHLRSQDNNSSQLLIITIAAGSIIYLSVLVFSMTFVDPATIFENRMIAPFYLLLVILGVIYLHRLSRIEVRFVNIAVFLLCIVLVASFARDGFSLVSNLREDGQGFANSWWRNPEMIEDIQGMQNVTLYSNRITALYLLTEMPAYTLPSPEDIQDLEENPKIRSELDVLRNDVEKGEAAIVIYGYGSYIKDPGYQDWVLAITDELPVKAEYYNITIFGR